MVIHRRDSHPMSRNSNKIHQGHRTFQRSTSSLFKQVSPSSIAENMVSSEIKYSSAGAEDRHEEDDDGETSVTGTDTRGSLTSVE